MNAHQALKIGIEDAQKTAENYLADLSDADLLVRAVPGSNHIAWQLGHLIAAENWMIETIRPGSMPKLPENFMQRHGNETAASDKPGDFLSKEEYLKLWREQRASAMKVFDSIGADELDQPVPDALKNFTRNIANVFSMLGTHSLMHAGQWSLVRRKLGRAPLF